MSRNFLILMLFVLSGCGRGFQATTSQSVISLAGQEDGQGDSNPIPGPSPIPNPNPSIEEPEFLGGICNELNFMGITWPQGLTSLHQKAFALGLDITGSFEGSGGWGNITNNFDGQGISLGLLQQNLGQGSLQPLLNKMDVQHLPILRSLFAIDDLLSMQSMLDDWNAAEDGSIFAIDSAIGSDDELFPDRDVLSPLDKAPSIRIFLTTRNQASVDWATSNLYETNGVIFKARWKSSLSKMALTPEYRSIQLEAALPIFNKAKAYYQTFGFSEMRMLLLMFDFVTQNGGFNSTHRNQYDEFRSSNPLASETTLALKLLEIRLSSVLDQYKEDVRLRKTALIHGQGRVHGDDRNLPVEYCFDPKEKVKY